MAEIRPFRGVLYDPAKGGDVTAVVAPPYDVIGPAEQTALYERHPCNVVRLELGQEHPGDGPQDNRYTRAKRFLDERRSEEHTSELQSRLHLVCRLLLEKKKTRRQTVL